MVTIDVHAEIIVYLLSRILYTRRLLRKALTSLVIAKYKPKEGRQPKLVRNWACSSHKRAIQTNFVQVVKQGIRIPRTLLSLLNRLVVVPRSSLSLAIC
jgi:hypothetical protein